MAEKTLAEQAEEAGTAYREARMPSPAAETVRARSGALMPAEEATRQILAGEAALDPAESIALVTPEGMPTSVAGADVPTLLTAGFRLQTLADEEQALYERSTQLREEAAAERATLGLGAAGAFVSSFAHSATLGLTGLISKAADPDRDVEEELDAMRNRYPKSALVGALAGTVLPALAAPGGWAALGKTAAGAALARTPAGILASGARALEARLLGSAPGLARTVGVRALGGAGEAAVAGGALALSEMALSEHPVNGETLASVVWTSAALGAAGGAIGGGAERLIGRAAGRAQERLAQSQFVDNWEALQAAAGQARGLTTQTAKGHLEAINKSLSTGASDLRSSLTRAEGLAAWVEEQAKLTARRSATPELAENVASLAAARRDLRVAFDDFRPDRLRSALDASDPAWSAYRALEAETMRAAEAVRKVDALYPGAGATTLDELAEALTAPKAVTAGGHHHGAKPAAPGVPDEIVGQLANELALADNLAARVAGQAKLIGDRVGGVPLERVTDYDSFVALAKRAGGEAPEGARFGDRKVFLSHIRKALGLPKQRFDQLVAEAWRKGDLEVVRADLVGAMDPGTVAASEVARGEARAHFLIAPQVALTGARVAARPGAIGQFERLTRARTAVDAAFGGGDPKTMAKVLLDPKHPAWAKLDALERQVLEAADQVRSIDPAFPGADAASFEDLARALPDPRPAPKAGVPGELRIRPREIAAQIATAREAAERAALPRLAPRPSAPREPISPARVLERAARDQQAAASAQTVLDILADQAASAGFPVGRADMVTAAGALGLSELLLDGDTDKPLKIGGFDVKGLIRGYAALTLLSGGRAGALSVAKSGGSIAHRFAINLARRGGWRAGARLTAEPGMVAGAMGATAGAELGGRLGKMILGGRKTAEATVEAQLAWVDRIATIDRVAKVSLPAVAQAAVVARVEHILAAASDPAGLEERVGDLGIQDPALADQVHAATVRGVEYLAATAPLGQPAGPGRPERPPNDVDISRWQRRVSVVERPAVVLDALSEGRLTDEHVEALRVVYPQVYDAMGQLLGARVADLGDRVPYEIRQGVAKYLGQTAEPSLLPENVAYLQGLFVPEEEKLDIRMESQTQPTTAQRVGAR